MGVKSYLIEVLICISLMTNVECVFTCLLSFFFLVLSHIKKFFFLGVQLIYNVVSFVYLL